MRYVIQLGRVLVALGAAGVLAAARAEAPQPAADGEAVFARVDGAAIGVELYDAELRRAFREKFYHKRPPEGQMAKLQREVGDALIERVLLLAEGKRRGIEPEAPKVDEALAKFEERNRANPEWQRRRGELMPLVVQGVREQNVLEQLERAVREVGAPDEAQLRDYYDRHPGPFTEPERLRLSVILLKVDPGAPQEDRDKAAEEARLLRQRLADGAEFAALARERSGDATAPQGGDMGYVHRGMLPDALQAQIDKLAPGTLSEPILLLEGMAIFRLEDRVPPKLRGLDESRERAARLWRQERGEQQWSEVKARLRAAAAIEVVDRSRYPPGDAKVN